MPYTWTTGETITAAKLNPTVVSLTDAAETDTWTSRTAITTARSSLRCAAHSGYVFAISGTTGTVSTANERYDPSANSWTSRAAIGTARTDFGCAAFGSYIYAFAGGSSSGNIGTNERYDVSANSWASRTALGVARGQYCAGAASSNYVYAIGGIAGPGTAERYDEAANSWSAIANPTELSRMGHGAGFAGGNLYVASGSSVSGVYSKTTEMYIEAINSWVKKNDTAPEVRYMAFAASDDYLYFAGGTNAAGVVSTVWRYDPTENQWTPKSAISSARRQLGGAFLSDYIYAVGGFTTTHVATNDRFGPVTAATTTTASRDSFVAAYQGQVINRTTGTQGPCVFAKNGDVIASSQTTDVLIF